MKEHGETNEHKLQMRIVQTKYINDCMKHEYKWKIESNRIESDRILFSLSSIQAISTSSKQQQQTSWTKAGKFRVKQEAEKKKKY